MNIARVFPSQTEATPSDPLAFYGPPPRMFPMEISEVHISVAFTWDKRRAETELAPEWELVAPVKIGGPAYGQPGAEFEPGMYLTNGYTITSRGCPNRCWFCSVHKREPRLIELPIRAGYIVQDDNLLACSERHIIEVFKMLGMQRYRAHLRGLEARLLKEWHVNYLCCLRPNAMWFACDTPDDYEPLLTAGKLLWSAGFTNEQLYCYVLIGFANDTMALAEKRLRRVYQAGFMPFAMLWRDEKGNKKDDWARFQRKWCRPAAIKAMCAGEQIITRRSILTSGRKVTPSVVQQLSCLDSIVSKQTENAVLSLAN